MYAQFLFFCSQLAGIWLGIILVCLSMYEEGAIHMCDGIKFKFQVFTQRPRNGRKKRCNVINKMTSNLSKIITESKVATYGKQ